MSLCQPETDTSGMGLAGSVALGKIIVAAKLHWIFPFVRRWAPEGEICSVLLLCVLQTIVPARFTLATPKHTPRG